MFGYAVEYGVKCEKDIPRGTFIGEYVGEIESARDSTSNYVVEMISGFYTSALEKGNIL